MEVLVGLSILALMLAIALPSVGPWLMQSRSAERQAQFWRSIEAAQLTASELTLAAIDLDRTLKASPQSVRFRTLAPRLALAPIEIEIAVSAENPGALLLRSEDLTEPEATLLHDGPPLRLRPLSDEAPRALVVEAELPHGWTPILTAPFAANAPRACAFDFISRTCR